MQEEKQIYIKTTESCNICCKHCYIGDARKNKHFFDEKQTVIFLKKYIEEEKIPEEKILFSFHGGEPLICPIEKIQYVCEAFPLATFNTTTNLVYNLSDNLINLFKTKFIDKNIGQPFIKTSWDYKIRFLTDGMLDLWESNVKTLLSRGIYVQVIICLTSYLINEVSPLELLEYFKNLGIQSINFERLTPNTTNDKILIPDYKKQNDWLYELCQLNDENKYVTIGMFEYIKSAINGTLIGCSKRRCMQDVLTINANGTIGGCPNTANCHCFGNIYSDIKELNTSPCRLCLIQKEQIKDSRCFLCEMFNFCNGDCHQLEWQGDICPAPKSVMKYLANKYKK